VLVELAGRTQLVLLPPQLSHARDKVRIRPLLVGCHRANPTVANYTPQQTPPALCIPTELTVEAATSDGAIVNYWSYAIDDTDPFPQVTCSPVSGSQFPVGTTTVNCTATDVSGNQVQGSFPVTVLAPLVLGVTVDPAGTVDVKTGVVTLSGTLRCSWAAAGVQLFVTVQQLFAKRMLISGTAAPLTDCQAPATAWQVQVSGSNGRFGAGVADVKAGAMRCYFVCTAADPVDQPMRLRPQ
jgi:HYR domain/Family of unknown function (DUF6299)